MDEATTDAVAPAVEKSDPKFLLAHMRRNSTGKIGGSCVRQPVASRFMRASMGSCHDLCKHGYRPVTESNKDTVSLMRKKSRISGNCGGADGENLGCMERGGCRRVGAEQKVRKEKGSLLRIGSNLSKGPADKSRKTGSSRWTALNAGKDRLDVLDVGTSSNDMNMAEGKGQNEPELCTSQRNFADLHERDSLPGPSSTKKPRVTRSLTERKIIVRARSGESLLRVSSFLSSSSQESSSSRGGKSRTAVRKGLPLDDKGNPGKKLSFRRVTPLECRSDDHPLRKLRFKRTISREIQASSSEYGRRNIRTVEPHVAADVKSRKEDRVMLRHRSMEKRQEGRRLFNNVIEETASKLVKVRKSKVKALVGAFETVISLQDKKV